MQTYNVGHNEIGPLFAKKHHPPVYPKGIYKVNDPLSVTVNDTSDILSGRGLD